MHQVWPSEVFLMNLKWTNGWLYRPSETPLLYNSQIKQALDITPTDRNPIIVIFLPFENCRRRSNPPFNSSVMDSSSAGKEYAAMAPAQPPLTAMAMENVEHNGNSNGDAPFVREETEAMGAERFDNQVDALTLRVNELEQRVKKVSEFYTNKKQGHNSKWSSSNLKDKDYIFSNIAGSSSSSARKKIDGGRREVCSIGMQEVMREFGTILKQLSQHKWAWPFLEPVDVKGLGLDDYYEIIKKPMDFTTIRNRMEANKYKHVREIYADMRLVFTNAMTYNEDDKNDVHVMAKKLLEIFQDKWLQLLPKVMEIETRQKEEAAKAMAHIQMAQASTIAKLARDTDYELNMLNQHVEELRDLVLQRCRKITTEDKRNLSAGISALSAEKIQQAVAIAHGNLNVEQGNSNFEGPPQEELDIDFDEQSGITFWRLKFFVKQALENQKKISDNKAEMKNSEKRVDEISKRKKVICDVLAKSAAKKRSKKLSF